MQSENIGELAKALSLAQQVIKPPTKGKTASIKSEKGSYSYKYADLADVIECYRDPLTKSGLAIVQTMRPDGGLIILTTTLLHASGQWVSSEYPINSYARPQEQGSAITYARRYAVTALLGIAAEDDDDGAATNDATPQPRHDAAPPDPNSDDAVILTVAQELGLITGQHPEDVIKAFSHFTKTDDAGKVKEFSFGDPRKQKNEKWKKQTREKLERELQKVGAMDAVGAEPVPF